MLRSLIEDPDALRFFLGWVGRNLADFWSRIDHTPADGDMSLILNSALPIMRDDGIGSNGFLSSFVATLGHRNFIIKKNLEYLIREGSIYSYAKEKKH